MARMRKLVASLLLLGQPALAQVPNYNPGNANPIWIAPDPRGANITHLNANGSVLLAAGKGWLSTISINTSATGTLTIYDGIDATGAVLAVIDVSKNTTNVAVVQPWPFQTGCFVVLNAAGS